MSKDNTYITVRELATELGITHSVLRRYIEGRGLETTRVRTRASNGQPTVVLTQEQAERVRERRSREGFTSETWDDSRALTAPNGMGAFYIIQLIPEFAPNRVKLGFTEDVQVRLLSHRTAAPTATLAKSWPCRRTWELAAIDSLTRSECQGLSNEVFDVEDLDRLIERGDAFFALMPAP